MFEVNKLQIFFVQINSLFIHTVKQKHFVACPLRASVRIS